MVTPVEKSGLRPGGSLARKRGLMDLKLTMCDTLPDPQRPAMSYKDHLFAIDRTDERSLTAQLVDSVRAAIEAGELVPGDRLPPTRAAAEAAGVNHLTAVRAYRRLAELGFVTAS